MRSIKFRAFYKGKMTKPFDLDDYAGDHDGEYGSWELPKYEPDFAADEAVFMQFTGLHDKNSKEIYEGDILKHDLWGNSQIIWEQGMFRGTGNDLDVTLSDHQLHRSRVIGNIYENPNLIDTVTPDQKQT